MYAAQHEPRRRDDVTYPAYNIILYMCIYV